MRLRVPSRARVLVIAPHYDDEVIGPGGTLALHVRLGSEVDVVVCAAGATPEETAVREAEARACAAHMGFRRLSMLGRTQGSLSLEEAELASSLRRILDETRPEQIFCPFVADHHRDHVASALALASAIEQSGWRGEVWCYEVWSPLWPNVAVDISSVVDVKRRAIETYVSQLAGLHYPDGIIGLNRYRALRVDVAYAEAFFVADETDFVELSREMNEV